MQVPPEITCRDVGKTGDIENLIAEKMAKLEHVFDYVVSCHVAIERPPQHRQTGNLTVYA